MIKQVIGFVEFFSNNVPKKNLNRTGKIKLYFLLHFEQDNLKKLRCKRERYQKRKSVQGFNIDAF